MRTPQQTEDPFPPPCPVSTGECQGVGKGFFIVAKAERPVVQRRLVRPLRRADLVSIPCRGGHELSGEQICNLITALVQIADADRWQYDPEEVILVAESALAEIGWPNASVVATAAPNSESN